MTRRKEPRIPITIIPPTSKQIGRENRFAVPKQLSIDKGRPNATKGSGKDITYDMSRYYGLHPEPAETFLDALSLLHPDGLTSKEARERAVSRTWEEDSSKWVGEISVKELMRLKYGDKIKKQHREAFGRHLAALYSCTIPVYREENGGKIQEPFSLNLINLRLDQDGKATHIGIHSFLAREILNPGGFFTMANGALRDLKKGLGVQRLSPPTFWFFLKVHQIAGLNNSTWRATLDTLIEVCRIPERTLKRGRNATKEEVERAINEVRGEGYLTNVEMEKDSEVYIFTIADKCRAGGFSGAQRIEYREKRDK